MPSVPPSTSSSANKRRRLQSKAGRVRNPGKNNKENIPWEPSNYTSRPGSQNLRNDSHEKSSQQLPQLGSEKPCPRTPANRIPLADLIGNTEDAFNCDPKDTTPEDHIYWQHGPTPRSSNFSATVSSSRKRKKRARSSSPAGSSQTGNNSSHQKPPKSLDLKTLHQSLKTPYNDPALDLWARYTDANIAKKDAAGNALPAFAHLMASSPQTPDTTNGKDGLRRSISCGTEWPASKAKRRKFTSEMTEGRMKDIFAASKRDIMAAEKCKASRISLLMEKLQENSAKNPPVETSGPSSSSPIPHRIGYTPVPEASPVSPLPHPMPYLQGTEGNTPDQEDVQAAKDQPLQQEHNGDDGSSEFGDDDLVLDDLEAVEQSAYLQAVLPIGEAFQQGLRHNSAQTLDGELETMDSRRAECQVSAIGGKGADSTAEFRAEDAVEIGDEFGEESDDSCAMADLAARYDTQVAAQQSAPQMQHDNPPSKNNFPGGRTPNEENDYDNDDDDDELWNQVEDGSLLIDHGQPPSGTYQKRSNSRAINRYLVVDVAESQFFNTKGRQQAEKVLSIKDEKTGMLKVVLLRQSWFESRCTKGSYCHLIGEFDHLGQCVVDDEENMIILHPDHLISATVVADSFSCTRRAVLQDRIKATGAAEPPQVYGHILHEVFGQALMANNWTADNLRLIIDKILLNWIEPLYEINTQVPQAADYLMSKMPELQAWASIFVNADARPHGEVHDRNGCVSNMNVNKLLEVEEHIWSPLYGLKGNVDATIQVTLQEPNEPKTKTLTVPLEFKTGKKDNNEMHRAQTELYTLLLSDRYDINVTCGVLYYLETSRTFRVQAIRNEIRHLVIQRNELACYVRNKLELPPMIKKPFLCNRCYAQTPCFTYHKLIDGGDGETSGLNVKFDEAVNHLKPIHQTFFRKWDELLTKEERDAMKFRRELWTMLSEEREALGRCFGNVYIEGGSAVETLDGPKINRYQYTFLKQTPKAGFSFAESQLTVGEPIVVSDEKGHFALANGYITNVRPYRLTVAVDWKLHHVRKKCAGFDPETNQVFNGIMNVTDHEGSATSTMSGGGDTMLYRVDKDEFSNGMATVRNNLVRIMEQDLFKARELRELVVEGRPPSFRPRCDGYTLADPSSEKNLNVDQVNAIDKVMRAKDYALVLGMPGTGKTTTIAQIIRALVAQNKSVLLTSYTHTAVDNILLKIKDDNIPILRLGAVSKVHHDVQVFADLGGLPKKTMAELENSYVNSKVVASTCLGVNHPIFNARVFDYCIVDEASQITLPTCLGPIRMAKTFILVGDHYQLPPLVQNKEAQEGGLDVSLFKMLSDKQPESVVNLEHQYRMAEDIMSLSNTLIYNGRLKCGTSAVANQSLVLPNLEAGLAAHHFSDESLPSQSTSISSCMPSVPLSTNTTCWLQRSMDPSSRCLFLNIDPIYPTAHSIASGPRITNPTEAVISAQLVHTLLSCGVPARSIGIITFYRSQLALLRQILHTSQPQSQSQCHDQNIQHVEISTTDRFQGRDKDVVILSCVRSNNGNHGSSNNNTNTNNNNNNVGDLLRDWRRVNVAITRAKSKLLIVGSKGTLRGSGDETLKGLIDLMESRKGWMVELPSSAVTEGTHSFPSLLTGVGDGGVATQVESGKKRRRSRTKPAPSASASPVKRKEKEKQRRAENDGVSLHRHHPPISPSPSPSPSSPSVSVLVSVPTPQNSPTKKPHHKPASATTPTPTPTRPNPPRRKPNKHFDGASASTSSSSLLGSRERMNGTQRKRLDRFLDRSAVLRDVINEVR